MARYNIILTIENLTGQIEKTVVFSSNTINESRIAYLLSKTAFKNWSIKRIRALNISLCGIKEGGFLNITSLIYTNERIFNKSIAYLERSLYSAQEISVKRRGFHHLYF